MESKSSVQLLVVLQLALLGGFVSATTTKRYFAVSSDISLSPTYDGAINRVIWYHQSNMVVDWDGDTTTYFSQFKDRATLNYSTAQLTIRQVDGTYAGIYDVEINQRKNDENYDVSVIERVLEATVQQETLVCRKGDTSCNFTCKAKVEGAQPVTYSWKGDDGPWGKELGDKTATLSNKELKNPQKLFCRVKNPVSEAVSEPVNNAMYDGKILTIVGATFGVLICVVFTVASAAIVYKKRKARRDKAGDEERGPATGSPGPSTELLAKTAESEKPGPTGDGENGNTQ